MKSIIKNSAFFSRSKVVLLFTLGISLLLNIVLFLRIPLRPKSDIDRRYSEERIDVFEALPPRSELRMVQDQITNNLLNSKNVKALEPITTEDATEKTSEPHTEEPTDQLLTEEPITQPHKTQPKSACPKMTIHQGVPLLLRDTVCKPHVPAEDVCRYTAAMFKIVPSIKTCHDQEETSYELCRITEIRNGIRLSAPEVTCDVSACLKTTGIKLLIVDPSDGNYLQLDLPGTIWNTDMAIAVKQGIEKTRQNGFDFIFIDCIGKKYREKISQLITFLPHPEILEPKGEKFENKVNVNVVLLDSISRPHFYRSLRNSVAYLREKSEDSSFPAHLFDFELFQSVHGHTHENEHALFSGTLYSANFTKSDKDWAPTNMEKLFGVFKNAGYQTMAQNDLCWKGWYGFVLSFMKEDYADLQKTMKMVIDSTGTTDASCKILKRIHKTTSFTDNGDHQICFNGKHQHRYLFDHLTHYLDALSTINKSKPLFSFTETNTAHDDVGLRTQTLDNDLVDLIDKVSRQSNTFTIIYADHGNTYTEYQVTMLEGRLETYHPILLGILPKELGRKFGKDIVENLKTNQYRLLHLFDIRESLVELANYDFKSRLKPVGIFGEVPKNRTCDDLKLSTPNYCICEGWDTPVENSTAQLALAEFAIGQLNNQLQSSFLAKRGSEPTRLFGACQRLLLQSITNVRQRQTAKGSVVTTIDVRVQSGNIVDQEELITVQVESAQKPGLSTFDMRLITFNRISQFSIYEQCVDPGVPLQLCICNKQPKTSTIYDVIGKSSKVQKLKPCLLLVKRSYSENKGEADYVGVEVYELANICNDVRFSVKFDAEAKNVRSSTELPFVVNLLPWSVIFASVMMTEVGYMDTRLKLKLRIVQDDLTGDGEKENRGSKRGREEENREESQEENLGKIWRKSNSKTLRKEKAVKWKRTSDKL